MKYQRDLSKRLDDRCQLLQAANVATHRAECGYLVAFIEQNAALGHIVEDLERTQQIDPAQWIRDRMGPPNPEWPPTEEARASLVWHLLNVWSREDGAAAGFGALLSRGVRDGETLTRIATQAVVGPLVAYLQEHLIEASNVLYLLERYSRRVAWFDQRSLFEAFEADRPHGEAIYDMNLRRFLFDEGVDFPLSQPQSASGKADVVVDVEGEDPLVCEVKLFDGASYGVPYLAGGFHQALAYARDYSKSFGYLVIFNLSDKHLSLPSDAPSSEWPPRIDAGGVTIFLVEVRAFPQGAASKRGRAVEVTITKEDLVRPIADQAGRS